MIMNDLYKAISIQAFDSCVEQCTKDEVNHAWLWERKYAELIVQECLTCVDGGYERESILSHFGMEG